MWTWCAACIRVSPVPTAGGHIAVAPTTTTRGGASTTTWRAARWPAGTNSAWSSGRTPTPATIRAPGVPDRAYATLAEIDADRWPDSANAPGTKGGDTWMNRAGTLAAKDAAGKPIAYQEWDVNPKQRNRSRDAERIVT